MEDHIIDQYKSKMTKDVKKKATRDKIDSLFTLMDTKKKLSESKARKEKFENYYGKVPKVKFETSKPRKSQRTIKVKIKRRFSIL